MEIGEFSVYYAEFSGYKCSIDYEYFLLRCRPLLKFSPVMWHLSPATRIVNENPVYPSLAAGVNANSDLHLNPHHYLTEINNKTVAWVPFSGFRFMKW